MRRYSRPLSLRRGDDLRGLLRSALHDASVVHIHGIWELDGVQAAIAAHRHKVPYVISTRGMLEPWALRHRHWKKSIALRLYQRRILSRASLLHATSIMERKNLEALDLGVPIATIPNGVWPGPFDWNAARKIAAARWPHLQKRRILLFLSRLHVKKGLDLLLDAWRELCELHGDWTLVVAGPEEGNYLPLLASEQARNGVAGPVYVGEVHGSDKDALLAAADLFVLPTHSENFGNVIAEALLAGTPVLTTQGTPWSVLEDTGSGWWIRLTHAELTAALRRACALNTGMLTAMGRNGRDLMLREYSWPSVARRMADAYRWLAHRGERPAFISG